MGLVKELYLDAVCAEADELMDEDVPEEEAYAEASEEAYYALADNLADRADRLRQEEKDSW
jgi:hypothetical protein